MTLQEIANRYNNGNINLRNVDLRNADLHDANLCSADLRNADLHGADLCDANLRGADLRGADLRGADIDYSVLPLWCGGTNIIIDDKIFKQLLAHLLSMKCDSEEFIKLREEFMHVALESHRASAIFL